MREVAVRNETCPPLGSSYLTEAADSQNLKPTLSGCARAQPWTRSVLPHDVEIAPAGRWTDDENQLPEDLI
jgi:hypothetical protein